MIRAFASLVFVALMLAAAPIIAQEAATSSTTCTVDDNRELTISYQPVGFPGKKRVLGREVPYGKVWAPGGKPMTLFTNTPLLAGTTSLPVGAYTVFVIPGERSWTLIISKSTDMSGKYDEKDDLVRMKMEVGELPRPAETFSAYFAHTGPTECNIRFDLASDRAWASLMVK